jgi:hypothetical protein
MRFLIIFLLLFTSCGDYEMGKPTQTLAWTATGNKTDPSAMGTVGYENNDLVASKFTNWQLANITEWQQFVDRAFGKTYYVKSTSGNDTTGDGSVTYPFKTIKKACDSIEDGGYGSIVLAEAGDYDIDADIDLYNKTVRIAISINTLLADVNFISYTDGGENSLYGFNLYRGSNLLIWAQNINIEAPDDTGNDWVEHISAVRVYDQTSHVTLNGVTGINITATTATGTDLPSLVSNAVNSVAFGTADLTVIGSITTNDNGYVLNARELLASINAFATIDNNNYWLLGGFDEQQPTLISCIVGDSTGGGTTLSIRSGSESISAGTGTEAETKIADLLSDAYNNIDIGDVAGVKTTVGGNLVLIQATVSGDSSAVIIGDIKSTANTTTYADVTQGYIIKNVNIFTNVTALK